VGVPSPDPTPAVAAAEARVDRASSAGIVVGMIVILIGLSWLGLRRLSRAGVRETQAPAAPPRREDEPPLG
jgi:hypothetical protein